MKYSDVSERIKQLRVQRGLKQVDLAKMLGVSKSVISAYENAIHLPPYDVLIRLSKIFGVSCDYLLGNSLDRIISTEGLTDIQINSIEHIIHELREINRDR